VVHLILNLKKIYNMANINLTTGIVTNGQFPVDGDTYFKSVSEITSKDINNEAFGYYERMLIKIVEDNSTWEWREVETAGEVGGLFSSNYTYPNGLVSNGIDYSNREFNFFIFISKSIFDSDLDADLEMQEDVGSIKAGTKISDLQGMTFTEYIEEQNFPTIDAYISVPANVTLSGQDTNQNEVGTSIVQSFSVTLDKGTINNGNNTYAGEVVGDMTLITVLNPDNNISASLSNPTSNTEVATTSNYSIGLGTNTWKVDVENGVGTTTYSDNKGGTDTISTIESAKVDETRDRVSFSMSGKYYRYHYLGVENSSPTISADVRALEKSFLSTSNTGSWTLSIPKNTQEVSFYIPSGKTHEVIDTGNLNNVLTDTFVESNITIDDAGGNGTSYTKYTIFLGSGGFPNDTNFNITIT